MKWLESLRKGDTVVIDAPLGASRVATVESIAKTSLTAGGVRFYRSNGEVFGAADNLEGAPRVIKATKAAVLDATTQENRLRMNRLNKTLQDRDYDIKTMRTVAKVIDALEEMCLC
jgi:hypothetical protein